MEYFSIEDPNKVKNNTNPGFQESRFQPQAVDDNQVNIPLERINKMGSSIPSVYARLFLFSSAFKQVNSYENENKGMGQKGIADQNGQLKPTSYHYLVSECLDMLEFIYIYGASENFGIIDYNIAKETQALQNDGIKEHERFAKALLDARNFGTLQGMTDIYLFTWGNQVIGGTSPLTLVYTSPNIRTYNITKKGGAGNSLFGKTPTPLSERSEGFKRFMYNYIYTMNLSEKSPDLWKYVSDSLANYDNQWQVQIKQNPILTNYAKVTFNGRAIDIDGKGTFLYFDSQPLNIANCGYVIQPSKGNVLLQLPLVLSNNGLDNVEYVNGRCWTREDHLPEILEANINKRKLPSTNSVYPYLTIDDFVENKIIETSFKIDDTHFIIGTQSDDAHVLLPLKQKFFDYFPVSDINKIVKINRVNDERLDVTLNIPIKAGSIELKKTYEGDDIIGGWDLKHEFNIAVFPFYKVLNGSNNYEVMLGTRGGSIDLSFQKEDGTIVQTTGELRSQGNDDNTWFYKVPDNFDLIEVKLASAKGIIVPEWHPVDLSKANCDFYFCMDFGTTNTHITYARVTAPDGIVKIPTNLVQTFDITQKERQVVTLDKNDSGDFARFKTIRNREFLPLEIGDKSEFKFPTRTVACQVNKKIVKPELFANMNIGFYYDQEISGNEKKPQNLYITNIKWNKNDINSAARMTEFFTQALWMMKNKALMNDGSEQIHLTYTYPQSMNDAALGNLKTAWDTAANTVGVNKNNIDCMYEGVAPYYSFLQDMKFGEAYMNMDIGGGTTDVFYRDPASREDFSLSAFFAANDIWGDGANPNANMKSNGLLQAYTQSEYYNAMPEESRNLVDAVLNIKNNNVRDSADAISYLFAHDDTTRFSNFVSGDPRMQQLPIAHFACLIYYAALTFIVRDIDNVPVTISFTGMGSKYIKMISKNDHSIEALIDVIFHYCGKVYSNEALKNSHVKVLFAENPKVVTAEGGLVQNTMSGKIAPDSVLCYGYEGEENNPLRYKEIGAISESVKNAYKKFLALFKDQNFRDTIDKINTDLNMDLIYGCLKQHMNGSYAVMAAQNSGENLKEKQIKEPLFFWCIKDALYKAGVELSKGQPT